MIVITDGTSFDSVSPGARLLRESNVHVSQRFFWQLQDAKVLRNEFLIGGKRHDTVVITTAPEWRLAKPLNGNLQKLHLIPQNFSSNQSQRTFALPIKTLKTWMWLEIL